MAIEGKYGVISAEKKTFHPGEPVFLLRSTDPLAPKAVREYGFLCERMGCSKEHVAAVMDHASRMEEWQYLEHPELVKKLPD